MDEPQDGHRGQSLHVVQAEEVFEHVSDVTTLMIRLATIRITGTRNSDGGSPGACTCASAASSRWTAFFFLMTRGGNCGASALGAAVRVEVLPAGAGLPADAVFGAEVVLAAGGVLAAGFGVRRISDMWALP